MYFVFLKQEIWEYTDMHRRLVRSPLPIVVQKSSETRNMLAESQHS